VYIGETGDLTLVSSAQAGTTYTTTLAELETIFEASPIDQKIYWRIDSINESGTTEGDEWNFDPRPTKSGNHSPVDEFGDMTLDWQEFTWDGVVNADSYNAYMGTDIDLEAEDLEQILDTSPNPSMAQAYMAVVTKLVYPNTGLAAYNYTYYWRVDTVNDFGITEGDVLEFGTIVYNPPLPWGMSMPSGGDDNQTPTGTPLGLNNMITIRKLVAAAGNKFWYESI